MHNDSTNKPDIRAYFGVTGSGKGVSIRQHLRTVKPRRLIVWDPMLDARDVVAGTTGKMGEVAAWLQRPSFALAFYPGENNQDYGPAFALLCRMVFAAGDVTFWVDELADVTRPGWAPPPWRRCTTAGRHRALRIIGASQRPADVDKAFFTSATYVRTCMLQSAADQRTIANALAVPVAQVAALKTHEDTPRKGQTTIHFIERATRTAPTKPGKLVIGR